jgi:hypothetical protein
MSKRKGKKVEEREVKKKHDENRIKADPGNGGVTSRNKCPCESIACRSHTVGLVVPGTSLGRSGRRRSLAGNADGLLSD